MVSPVSLCSVCFCPHSVFESNVYFCSYSCFFFLSLFLFFFLGSFDLNISCWPTKTFVFPLPFVAATISPGCVFFIQHYDHHHNIYSYNEIDVWHFLLVPLPPFATFSSRGQWSFVHHKHQQKQVLL